MKDKTIIVIDKVECHKYPPVISALFILLELGYKPVLITSGLNDEMRYKLKEKGATIHIISPSERRNNKLLKIAEYLRFRKKAFEIVSRYDKKKVLLWIAGAHTVMAMGTRINKFNTIIQVHELHDKTKIYLWYLKKTLHNALTIFMPEYHRSIMYQIRFGLSRRPVLLPNKPYFIPTSDELHNLENKYPDYVNIFKSHHVILYQGIISPERDLSMYIEAVKKLSPKYKMVLLGPDLGVLKDYKDIDPDIIHIDFIPAPDYLLFTSLAYIGIATYSPMTLNTAYCAPNKLYEYSALSLPILANDIPGLNTFVTKYNAGVIVDENDPESIVNGIETISADIETYRKNVRHIYEATDNKETIRKVLDDL